MTCTQCATTMSSATNWVGCAASNGSNYPLQQQIGRDANRNPEPSYFWNNLFNGTNQTPTPWSSQMSTYVQLNRDYFVSTGKPAALSSYSAYAYPHPLRLNSGAPGPPTNVMNTVR